MDQAHLEWPFFAAEHRALAETAHAWAQAHCATAKAHGLTAGPHGVNADAQRVGGEAHDVDGACRAHVAALGTAGLLRHVVPARFGGMHVAVDSRSVCLLRETLAWHDGLADFALAMQGVGGMPLALCADENEVPAREWLPRVAAGTAIAAFALSEPGAGSDAAALALRATRDGDDYVLDGEKTFISNGGIADFYVTFARTGGAGADGISAFVVPADAPGLRVAERIATLAPHPLARLAYDGVRVASAFRLGAEGTGFRLAMRTLDVFRASVGAAALGFARRALDLAVTHARSRAMFGGTLADRDLARAKIGELATHLDAAALLVYRAAWRRDVQGARTTVEAAMAKMSATEWGQAVIDGALQLHGGLGVTAGHPVERLYREIRALRIYEGATEVQQLIVGKGVLSRAGMPQPSNTQHPGALA